MFNYWTQFVALSNEKFQPGVERSQQRREPVAVVNKKRCFDQSSAWESYLYLISIWNYMPNSK
jgi:hypothetical protein